MDKNDVNTKIRNDNRRHEQGKINDIEKMFDLCATRNVVINQIDHLYIFRPSSPIYASVTTLSHCKTPGKLKTASGQDDREQLNVDISTDAYIDENRNIEQTIRADERFYLELLVIQAADEEPSTHKIEMYFITYCRKLSHNREASTGPDWRDDRQW
ncbi:hypothetical protein DPMN_146828 [Dreissena polymorpha]|uniref:Uncharacterized protein n=1 Tax=Dreissena polymorpha TaxID=45954 RepID=A0A9D4FB14_DREPO|nr:hypothetical protein DPMN_146828 [Dreissena polymorpha]